MSWHSGLPSRAAVAQLLRRAFSLAVVAFGLTACVLLALEVARRHDASSNIAPFDGWQFDLAVAGLGMVGLVVIASGLIGLRRLRLLPNTPVSFQVLAAFIAIVIGWSAATEAHHAPERVANWAANRTAAAGREQAEDREIEHQEIGDATHPPRPFGLLSTSPAPRFATAPLLRASDLGKDWYLQGKPNGDLLGPGQDTSGTGILSSANVPIAQEIWNGRFWVLHLGLLEMVRRFHSAQQAREAVAQEISDEVGGGVSPSTIPARRSLVDKVRVWRLSSGVTSIRTYFSVGKVAIELAILPSTQSEEGAFPGPTPTFPAVSDRQILRAAIRRAEAIGH